MPSPSRCSAVLLLLTVVYACPVTSLRHIVFMVADDLGWNDVGFRNPDMITPNIDKLARSGVILNSSYVQPVCTPSRHSFMTGVYPFKAGLQRGVIAPNIAQCSPLDLTFLPQELKQLGYATHIIGKWHLGHCNWNCTPTYRGFDTFYGYYNGKEDYYSKVLVNGKDLRDNVKPVLNVTYSSEVYADRAATVIKKHPKDTPMFLYLPFQSVHSPIQVPKKYEELYPNIENDARRQYCGMVSAMDEAIGRVRKALEDAGMFDDTLIIFTADNGGMPTEGGNNWPLRGGKTTVFEGGTRASAFVYGSGLEKSGYTYDGLIHAVDWKPTILAAAGGQPKQDKDGINQWEALSTGGKSERNELVYNIDDTSLLSGHAAIRVNNMKYIDGFPGLFLGWYKPPEDYKDDIAHKSLDDAMDKQKAKDTSQLDAELFTGLFDLEKDPNERNDLSKDFPDIVKQMKEKLNIYRKSTVPSPHLLPDPAANPENFGGYWSPGWC